MKHIVLLIGLFSALGFCMGQTGIEYQNVQLDSNKLSEANADIAQIEIDFCDKPGEKAINYSVAPGGNQDICFKATNMSDKDIEVTIGFVDGTVTNDQRKNKACMEGGEDKNFGQYVSGFVPSFVVPANNFVFKHAKLQLPKGSEGSINGCLVYYTKSVEMGGNINFSVLMRKAKFIDITIKQKAESIKLKALGIFLGVIILLLFFKKFKKNKKNYPSR